MPDKPQILVVGSIAMDMAMHCPHLPSVGQTIRAANFVTSPGGKGLLQATAAARMGGQVRLIGCVGDDVLGRQLIDALQEEGIDTAAVCTRSGLPTGVAVILVDSKGENTSIVSAGANAAVTADDHLFTHEDMFKTADIVLLQLELPLPTLRAAANLARSHGCTIVLDPAPGMQGLCSELSHVDVICPNVIQAELITGKQTGEERGDMNIGLDLIAQGAQAAVLKLGPRGCLVVTGGGEFERVPPYKVDIADTSGAGDAFTGALVVALARKHDLATAAKWANAAGALACTRIGTLAALPTYDEVRLLMADNNK
ncbi:MAG: ribokinase [Planctomycetaceae bacterium]|nr:ribokinase [Planctomycetaceae bacterium]